MTQSSQVEPNYDVPSSIGKPALRALTAAGYTRLDQFSAVTEADLQQLHGVGPKAIRVIRSALSAHGLAFAAPSGASHNPPIAEPGASLQTTFITTVTQAEDVNATGLPVPTEAVAALGSKKRPPVKVTLNGYTYRTTVAAYGDLFMLPLSAEHRNAAGVQAGEQLAVTLELDTEPRTVDVPADLAAGLAEAGAAAAFDRLSYTQRKEHVRQVETAKAAETRQRRIEKIVASLAGQP
jgi:hypothetical protein